ISTHQYDALNRLIEVAVEPGPTVDPGTSLESFGYDGRSLLVLARDDDSSVSRSHDSLGGLLAETQALLSPQQPPLLHTVSYQRDGLGNPTRTIYPSGRTITRTFDGLRRTRLLGEADESLVRFDYLGPDLQRRQVLPLELQSSYSYDADHRMIGSRHAIGDDILDDREYGYDPAGNKLWFRDLGPAGLGGAQQVMHDSLNQSYRSQVTGGAVGRQVHYGFDGTGNRT